MNIRMKCTKACNYEEYGIGENGVVTLDVEEYLRYVVPNEIGGSSAEAALKAQAIAARTFAMYRVIGPRTDTYDILDNTNDQSFQYGTQTDAADEAIEATAGQVLTWNDKVFKAFYCSSSGGTLVDAHDVYGNYPCQVAKDDPWTRNSGYAKNGKGVGMSQRGAQWAGRNGIGYEEILAFYYDGAEIMDDYAGIDDNVETEPVEDEETVVESDDSDDDMDDLSDVEKSILNFAIGKLGTPYKKMDCAGLIRAAMKSVGLTDWKSSTYWQWLEGIASGGKFEDYGKLDTIPDDGLVLLYHYGERSNNKGKGMIHVALYYIAGKYVIQSGGYGGTGVHKNAIEDRSKPLTHFDYWAKPDLSDADMENDSSDDEEGEEKTDDTRATIRRGSSGDLVKELQTLLNEKNNAGLTIDGLFGPLTQKAVLAWQKKNGLAEDSIVGKNTWNSLTA